MKLLIHSFLRISRTLRLYYIIQNRTRWHTEKRRLGRIVQLNTWSVLGPTRDLLHVTLLSHHPTIYLLPLCILVFSLQRFSTAEQHAVQQPIRVYCICVCPYRYLVAICTNFADHIDELFLVFGKNHSVQACKVDSPFVPLNIIYLTIFVRQIVNPFWMSY